MRLVELKSSKPEKMRTEVSRGAASRREAIPGRGDFAPEVHLAIPGDVFGGHSCERDVTSL